MPGHDRQRLPQAAELVDHRGAGHRRSEEQPAPLRRRPAAAVRAQSSATADLQHIARGGEGATGLLVPDIAISSRNGFELALPYHWQIGPNRDLTITPHVYTSVLPGDRSQISPARQPWRVPDRRLSDLRRDRRTRPDRDRGRENAASAAISTAMAAGSSSPDGRSPASLRAATDKTVTRRYDLTNDDRLRNVINAERITPDSYISIAGWAFQGLRVDDEQKQIPIALPAIDARFRLGDVAGGNLEVAGQQPGDHSDRRAGHPARIRQRPHGTCGELPLGPGADSDRLRPRRRLSYRRCRKHTTVPSTAAPTAGTRAPSARLPPTSNGRSSARCSAAFSGSCPRVQFVLTPPTPNIDIPNEDARSVDLEDSNLFALNRFPGYDRWEDARA